MRATNWMMVAALAAALAGCGGDDGEGRRAEEGTAAPAGATRPADSLLAQPGDGDWTDIGAGAPMAGDGSGDEPVDTTGGGAAGASGAPAAAGTSGRGSGAGGGAGGGAATPASSGTATGAASGSDAAGGATSQAPSTAELLRATARAYRDVRSMQADFEQRLHNTLLGRTVPSSGTLYQRQPDRFLMQFSDPEGDVIVSDGRYFWLYFPSTDPRQVIRARRGAQGLDLQSQFIGDPVARFDATYHGRETDRGRATHVMTLVPREPLGYEKLKVWIDDRDHLIRRFELTEGNGIVRRFELSDLRLNPSLPDRLFDFTPPEGAQVVEQG